MKTATKVWIVFGIFLILQDLLSITTASTAFRFADDIIFLAIFAVVMVRRVWDRSLKFDKITTVALIIFIYSCLMDSMHFHLGLRTVIYTLYALKTYLMYLLAQNLGMDKEDLLEVLDFFSKVFIALGAIGLLDIITGNNLLQSLGYTTFERMGMVRLQSLFVHPYAMGWMSALFSFYFLLKYLMTGHKNSTMLGLIFSIAILVLTGSRKSLAAFILLSAVVYILYIKRTMSSPVMRRTIYVSFVTLFIIVLIAIPFLSKIIDYTKAEYLEGGTIPRFILYETGYSIMMDNFPIGTGVATFASIGSLSPYSSVYYHYHLDKIYGLGPNDPVRYILDAQWASYFGELGLIGTILMIVLFILILYKLLHHLDHETDLSVRFLLIFGIYALTEGLLESIVASTHSQLLYLYFIIGTIGIATSSYINAPKHLGKTLDNPKKVISR